ncbi:DUF421 domain-containing protein [Garciella nitratireducens]|uniref:DUF421 domain-containing protein n=1 Tax=Garciella nitratireducens TaxID=218205 RepID=UPI000DEBE791|nr:DUF421 domain-containing protein [Garciella nitratireducens]RBP39542.1 uncharacterized membrane protein YcaP (DUF421 family) [Garciella nitratireducens]
MLIVFIRVVILYISVLLGLRMMGKRQIGEMQPFELVITIMISELAAIPIENTGIPLLNGMIPIFTLLFLEGLFSVLMLKSNKFRNFIDGTPSIIMDKGKLIYKELKNQRIAVEDLFEELRIAGYPDLHEIEYVILETDGELTIIPKAENKAVTLKDMNIVSPPVEIPILLIVDGVRDQKNMKKINCDNQWLDDQIKAQGFNNDKEILIAYLDSQRQFHIQGKNEGEV